MNRPLFCLGCVSLLSLTVAFPAFAQDETSSEQKRPSQEKPRSLAYVSGLFSAGHNFQTIPINAHFAQALRGRNERLLFEMIDRRVQAGLQSQQEILTAIKKFEVRANPQDLSALPAIKKAQNKVNGVMEQVVLISKSLLNIVQTDENNGLSGQSESEQRLLSDVIAALHRLDRAHQQQKMALASLSPNSSQSSIKAITYALDHMTKARRQIRSYVVHLKTRENREVLESLVRQLNGVLRRQKTINSQTKDLAQAQRSGELAPEDIKNLARQLADSKSQRHPGELQLANRVLEVLELIGDEESSVTFPVILGELSSDLRDLGQLLKDGDLGRVTQSMQADIVKTIDGIVDVLKAELKKSKKAKIKPRSKRREAQPSPL